MEVWKIILLGFATVFLWRRKRKYRVLFNLGERVRNEVLNKEKPIFNYRFLNLTC